MKNYIIDENDEVVEEPDLRKWCDWMEAHRGDLLIVKETKLLEGTLTTGFLGVAPDEGKTYASIYYRDENNALSGSMVALAGSKEAAIAAHDEFLRRIEHGRMVAESSANN